MNKRKKIIIVNNNFDTGGVQKALVNLLNEIKDQYDITLYLFSVNNERKKDIPNQVKIIEANKLIKLLGISQEKSREEGIIFYLIRALFVIWTKIFSNSLPFKLLFSSQKTIDKFDIAISYLHNSNERLFYGGCNEFVLSKIKADQKITFIHCDYLKSGANTRKNKKIYLKFDKVIAVSEGCGKSFSIAIPEMNNRVFIAINLHNYNSIRSQANDLPIIYSSKYFNVVTVSRLGEEKGIMRTIQSINHLVRNGYQICWHIIGDGYQRKDIELSVKSYNLSDNIILYGNQLNPYRYMKNADLFLLPSFHEAAPMVIDEAKCIGLPILTTKTSSSKEMIIDCRAGWVCENSTDGITSTLKHIIDSPVELEETRQFILEKNYSNKLALEQFHYALNEGN
ncbi:glycosyltransferase [Lysinibacillus sp. BW-2-10]|uniref:glycosyltransferase n=1 Tax=Lysinibacillus sp. BW-2-10 TaxID=2590030 RepID=UPI0011807303|nr:glycosyltransferase [Lysinibacillus sp. BW-2-10]TSI11329.1 glycosyltransferase [Lysinibacillus sp. BW-2-10]